MVPRPGGAAAPQGILEMFTLRAADGYALAADLHHPPGGVAAAAVLAPAMGVRREFYRPVASWLAEGGVAVLVPDYRGIGGSAPASLRGFPARLRDWAELDLQAALDAVGARFPDATRVWLGHSVGGQILGLLREPPVERAVFVGAQSGWAGHWDGLGRLTMLGLWYVAVPALVAATGLLPMKTFRQGEDVPPGVALEWARWGRQRDYVLSYARGREGLAFERWRGGLRSYAIADDGYAPRRAVEALAGMYRAARAEVRVVAPRDLGADAIGHFGCFKPRFKDTLWREWRDALLGA